MNWDRLSACTSLNNMCENMEMKEFAKDLLLEENYIKFMKSYNFTFKFQLFGTLGVFLIPCIILLILTNEIAYMTFGVIISLLIPPTQIYRKFDKWYRKNASLRDLDDIFYNES